VRIQRRSIDGVLRGQILKEIHPKASLKGKNPANTDERCITQKRFPHDTQLFSIEVYFPKRKEKKYTRVASIGAK